MKKRLTILTTAAMTLVLSAVAAAQVITFPTGRSTRPMSQCAADVMYRKLATSTAAQPKGRKILIAMISVTRRRLRGFGEGFLLYPRMYL